MQIFKIFLPLATHFHLRGIVNICYYYIRASEEKLDIKDDIMLALVKYKQAKDRYETENKDQEI